MITLQDIEVLLGLRTLGRPVIGKEGGSQQVWRDLFEHLLGFTPESNDFKGYRMKLSAVSRYIELPNPNLDEIVFQRQARMYILNLIGGMLFPDLSGNYVPVYYLQFLCDFDECRSYS